MGAVEQSRMGDRGKHALLTDRQHLQDGGMGGFNLKKAACRCDSLSSELKTIMCSKCVEKQFDQPTAVL